MVALGVLAVAAVIRPALAADNLYHRGPDPTAASVSANRGAFATAQVSMPAGNGLGGGVIYYPTDASGQSISQLWNGTLSASGSSVSVRNASCNGALQPFASTTFGFLGGGAPVTPALTCTSP